MGMRRATADSKLNGSPDNVLLSVMDWLELEKLFFLSLTINPFPATDSAQNASVYSKLKQNGISS